MMSKKIRICIIAPVATDHYNKMLVESIAPVLPPDVQVDIRNIPDGDGTLSIEYRVDWLRNGFPVVQMAQQIEAEGYDGIWLSDFDMCGVEAAREIVNIPIIGGFPPSAFTALALCERFSIITILQSTVGMQRNHPQSYGIQDGFASIYPIDCPVDDLDDMDIVVSKVFQLALKAVQEDAAQSILLGCTGFMGVAARVSVLLEDTVQMYIPVIDPNQAGFSFLVSLVRMKIRPSRACYSQAPPVPVLVN
jgi:allantoin racemase